MEQHKNNILNSSLRKNNPSLKMMIDTDYELWNLLFQNNNSEDSRKLTKGEAYFDLMKRQRLVTLTKDDSYLGGGILALAKAWKWDRNTVKKFIDALCAIDAATITMVGNRAVITLKNVSFPHQHGSEN